MAETRRKKTVEIPVTFANSIRYIKGVTKYTTCGDVIKMVLRKVGDGKENGDSEAYGIYESSRGIERLLPAKSRLLKVMRSWGMDNNFEFVFRKVNLGFSIPKMSEAKRRKLTHAHCKMHSESGEKTSIDNRRHANECYSHSNEFVKELYFKYDTDNKVDRFMSSSNPRSMAGVVKGGAVTRLPSNNTCNIGRNITEKSEDEQFVYKQSVSSYHDLNNVKFAIRKTLKPKTCTISTSEPSLDAKVNHSGSKIANVERIVSGKRVNEAHITIERHEQLASDIVQKVTCMNQRAGKEELLQKYFADYITYRSPRIKIRDSLFRERGDGAESDDVIPSDEKSDSTKDKCDDKQRSRSTILSFDDPGSNSDDEDGVTNFDTAFIVEEENKVSTEPSNNITYNTKRVRNLVDYSLSEDDSVLSEPSDLSTCNDHVHNTSSVSDIVKAVFHENMMDLNEDDEMESFMNTIVYDEVDDEGLSSLGSDAETEIIV